MKRILSVVLAVSFILASCAPESDEKDAAQVIEDAAGGADAGADVSDEDGADAGTPDADQGPAPDLGPVGGDRPVGVKVPVDYDDANSYPLVVLLHGYTATSLVQDAYFRLSLEVTPRQFILALPEGTKDSQGEQFWAATDRCCNFDNSDVDDSAYLRAVVKEIQTRYSVDPARIYFMGHSNGGYMSFRMACDHSDIVAGIASLAGSSWWDASRCPADTPVSILQIHGTADPTVRYTGLLNVYPGARALAERWAERNGCTGPDDLEHANYDSTIVGDETAREAWTNCQAGTEVQLWSIEGAGHIPAVGPVMTADVLDFLFEHPKQ